MKREFFNKQFAALVSAYTISNKLQAESQDVYWEMLKGIHEEAFAAGVRKCLAGCKFFPTIAELGEASLPAKEELSDYMVQTKNGMDRVRLRVGWEQQVERAEAKKQRIDVGLKSLAGPSTAKGIEKKETV